MKLLYILFSMVVCFSYADYQIRIPLESHTSLKFKDNIENSLMKIEVVFSSAEPNNTIKNNSGFIVMPSNWVDNKLYISIGGNNFNGISNAYFTTGNSGPHPLDLIYESEDIETNRFLISFTSNDPTAPKFDIDLDEYEYSIYFNIN